MEANEVLVNEEVFEPVAEGIAKAGAGSSRLGVAAGFGLGLLAGVAICKLAKPVMAKIREHKALKKAQREAVIDVEAEEIDGGEDGGE